MRLIDADKLPKYTGYALSANEVAIDVEKAPTVDAVPVVHGKWIPFEGETGVEAFGYKEHTTLGFKCSVCHANIDVSEQYFRYCPMCGSKMNGERKGGERVMFVLHECQKAVQNSDSPYMAVALAVVLVVCVAVGVWAIVKGRDE